jgi:hypothetical protein
MVTKQQGLYEPELSRTFKLLGIGCEFMAFPINDDLPKPDVSRV